MIGTIRKHSKVLWWIVIVVVVITFVWWGSQRSDQGGGSGEGNYGIMNGQVITPTLFEDAAREVKLNYFYSSGGTWPGQGRTMPGFEMDLEVFKRLLLIQKAAEMGVHVSDDAVARAVSARMRAVTRGNPVPIAEFEKQFLNPARLNFADFERFVRNELGIQLLAGVAGAGGDLVTPQEIEALYRRDFQEVSVQAVFFHATNHFAAGAATPEKLGEFYTNRQAYYRLPDRMQVNYVRFPRSNFLAQAKQELDQVTNLNELVEAKLLELGTNYLSEAKTPEEAKGKMILAELERIAFQAAGKAAEKFDKQMYDSLAKDSSYKSEAFAALAKEQGLTAQVTAPFSAQEPPAGLGVNAEFGHRAFNLTPEDPLTEPLAGEQDVYVIAYHRQLPSENPPYETLRERVTQDFRFVEAAMSARQAGYNFHAAATNGLGAGKSFATVCTAAGVKPVSLAPFSQNTRNLPEVEKVLNPQEFKQAAFATAPGQVGPLLASGDGAVLVFVQARLPVDEAALRTNLPAFTRSVHQVRRGEVFNEWFSREADKAFSTVPYFQQRRAQMSGAPAK